MRSVSAESNTQSMNADRGSNLRKQPRKVPPPPPVIWEPRPGRVLLNITQGPQLSHTKRRGKWCHAMPKGRARRVHGIQPERWPTNGNCFQRRMKGGVIALKTPGEMRENSIFLGCSFNATRLYQKRRDEGQTTPSRYRCGQTQTMKSPTFSRIAKSYPFLATCFAHPCLLLRQQSVQDFCCFLRDACAQLRVCAIKLKPGGKSAPSYTDCAHGCVEKRLFLNGY